LSKDYLISIDMKVFDKSIDKIIRQLNALEKDVDSEIERLTYWASSIIVKEAKTNHAFVSRTGTLVRSIHSAPKGAGHSGDQRKAEKGTNLEGSKGEKGKRVGDNIEFQIGSWLDYAYPVERGTKFMSAKPYLLPAMESKFKDSVDFIVKGLRIILEKRKVI